MEPLLIVTTLPAAAGYIASQIIELAKPFLKARVPEEQRNAASRLLALVITGVVALAAGAGAEALGLINPGEAWLVFGVVFPATGAWFQVDSRRRVGKDAARAAMFDAIDRFRATHEEVLNTLGPIVETEDSVGQDING